MCGIVAMITKRPSFGFTHNELKAFKAMLLVDSLRGEDSTGVYGVENNGNVHILKAASHSGVFLQDKEFDAFEQQMVRNGWLIVGHNRKATRGIINDTNAHPFWVNDEVVLVHNGTFVGDHKKHADVEVDSHAFAHVIQKHEPEDYNGVFNAIHAAYATMWYDVRNASFNVARNSQRPLFFAESKTCWLMASEPDFIHFGAARGEMILEDKPKLFLHDIVMQIKLDNNKQLVRKKFDLKIDPKTYTSYTSYTTTKHPDACGYDSCEWPEMTEIGTPPLDKKSTVLQLLPKPTGQGTVIDSVKVKEIIGKPTVTEISDAIVNRLTNGGENGFAPVPFPEWERFREVYPTGARATFEPFDIVHVGQSFLLYGTVPGSDGILAVTEVDEKQFDDQVKEGVLLEGTVTVPYYKNSQTNGSTDQRDWKGFMLVHLKDVQERKAA